MSLDNVIATGRECVNGTTNIDSLLPHSVWSISLEVGANPTVFQIQDGATAVNLWEGSLVANANSVCIVFPKGLMCPNGIKVIVTGVGGKAYITYI